MTFFSAMCCGSRCRGVPRRPRDAQGHSTIEMQYMAFSAFFGRGCSGGSCAAEHRTLPCTAGCRRGRRRACFATRTATRSACIANFVLQHITPSTQATCGIASAKKASVEITPIEAERLYGDRRRTGRRFRTLPTFGFNRSTWF